MIVQRLAVHQTRLEFRQQFNGAIRTSLTALYGLCSAVALAKEKSVKMVNILGPMNYGSKNFSSKISLVKEKAKSKIFWSQRNVSKKSKIEVQNVCVQQILCKNNVKQG